MERDITYKCQDLVKITTNTINTDQETKKEKKEKDNKIRSQSKQANSIAVEARTKRSKHLHNTKKNHTQA